VNELLDEEIASGIDGADRPTLHVRQPSSPVNRRQLKATALYTFFGVLPLLSQFFLFPINTRFLAPSEFGVTTLANVCRGYLLVLLMFGFDAALGRLYFDVYQKPEALRRLLGTVFSCLLIAVAASFVVGALGGRFLFSTFFGGALPFSTYGWYTLGATAVQAFGLVLLLFYRISEDVKQYARLAFLSFVLPTAGAVIGITVFRLGAFGSVAGRCIGQIAVVLPIAYVVFRRVGLHWDSRVVKEMLRYGAPVTLCAVLAQSNIVFDKMMTASTFGLSDLGVYTAANTIAYSMVFALDGFWNAVSPDVYRILTERPANMHARLDKYAETMVLLSVGCFIGLVALIWPVLRLLVSKSYQGAAFYVPLLGLAYLWRPLYLVAVSNIYYHKKTQLLPFVYGGSLAAMGLFFAFVGRHLGMLGICLSVLVGEFSQFIISHICAGASRERYFSARSKRRVALLISVAATFACVDYTVVYPRVATVWATNLVEAAVIALVAGVLYRWQIVRVWQSRLWLLPEPGYVIDGNK
jgi:O-antigen/teichoic acid export membrane protein